MADNSLRTPGSGESIATDEVTYSGDTTKVQIVRLVTAITGAEGAKTVVDAAALADNTSNPTVVHVGSFPHVYDGSTWDRLPGTSADGALVNLGANNDVTVTSISAGDNNIGNVDIVTVPAPLSTTGNGTAASALRVTVASDSTGVIAVTDNGSTLSIDDGGSSITVDGTVAVTNAALNAGSNSALKVEGCTAHDGTDGGNPVAIGANAVAHGASPTAVAAGDRTRLYANRHGILFSIGGHPNVVSASVRIADATGAQTDAAIAPGTIGTGTKIVITRMTILCSNANTGNVACKVGFGATTLPADSTTGASGVIVDHEGIPPGGGVNIGDGSGMIAVGGDGEELRLTCDDPVGGFITVSYSYYTIES